VIASGVVEGVVGRIVGRWCGMGRHGEGYKNRTWRCGSVIRYLNQMTKISCPA